MSTPKPDLSALTPRARQCYETGLRIVAERLQRARQRRLERGEPPRAPHTSAAPQPTTLHKLQAAGKPAKRGRHWKFFSALDGSRRQLDAAE